MKSLEEIIVELNGGTQEDFRSLRKDSQRANKGDAEASEAWELGHTTKSLAIQTGASAYKSILSWILFS